MAGQLMVRAAAASRPLPKMVEGIQADLYPAAKSRDEYGSE
jgi:hypothetical protein